MSNQYLSFDVTKQSVPQELIIGRQGDSQLKFVSILCWDGEKNVPYDLTGKQVVFEALKPDGTHIVDTAGITILNATGGLVRYSFNEQVFAVAGTMQQAFFKITQTDSQNNVITDSALEINIRVLENRVEFGINSKDYLSEYDKLVADVEKKFDDYATTVQKDITQAQAIHDQIVEFTSLINSNAVITKSEFGDVGLIKQPVGATVVDKLNNEFGNRGVNLKWFGAIGDGVTDDTAAFKLAIKSKSPVFIPSGAYLISEKLTLTNDITSAEADIPIVLIGAHDVEIVSELDTVIDFSKSKYLVMKNIKSKKTMKLVNYGADELSLQKYRFVELKNVLNTAQNGKNINWHNYLNTPAPEEYKTNDSSGAYSRYPIEIQNWGGFNPIMITNHSDSVEASPIGITDDGGKNGPLSSPSLLIDQTGGSRAWIKIVKGGSTLFNGSGNSIAIGADVNQADMGAATLKVADKNPLISLIDRTTGKRSEIRYWGGILTLVNNGKEVFKANDGGEITLLAPSGISQNITIRDSSNTRGLLFNKVATDTYRLIYTDSDNRLRTTGFATAASDKVGALIQTNSAVTSDNRPVLRNDDNDKGYMIFDKTLLKPIWWTGLGWVDGSGNKA